MSDEEQQPPEEHKDDAKPMPKHMRLRYWTSFEELRLVELWRRHNSDVTTLAKNMPVFRTIAEGMKEYGFYVNGQECRRKINSLKNRYIAERRQLENGKGQQTSEWRLYPLVHCLLMPKQKEANLLHEMQTVHQMLSQMHWPLGGYSTAPPTNPMDAVLSAPPPLPPPPRRIQKATALLPATAITSTAISSGSDITTKPRRAYAPRRPLQERLSTEFIPAPPTAGVHLLLRRHITMAVLEQEREDNVQRRELRDIELKRLRVEEQEYSLLERYLTQWQHKQQHVLQQLQAAGQQ